MIDHDIYKYPLNANCDRNNLHKGWQYTAWFAEKL